MHDLRQSHATPTVTGEETPHPVSDPEVLGPTAAIAGADGHQDPGLTRLRQHFGFSTLPGMASANAETSRANSLFAMIRSKTAIV